MPFTGPLAGEAASFAALVFFLGTFCSLVRPSVRSVTAARRWRNQMLQTGKNAPTHSHSKQRIHNRRSRNPEPIVVAQIGPEPVFKHGLPDFAVGFGFPSSDISPDLAYLVTIAAERQIASERSSRAADSAPNDDVELRYAERFADAAHMAAIQSVIHEPAKTLKDVLVKFSVVRDTADLEDIAHQMERPGSTQTERMLWSICSDLLQLGNKASTSIADGFSIENLPPDVLAHRLKLATAEFVRLRDDSGSSPEAFDTAAGSMDNIYNALISRKADRPSIVALQLAAVASHARLHARKGEEPELDEAIGFGQFERLVENLASLSEAN